MMKPKGMSNMSKAGYKTVSDEPMMAPFSVGETKVNEIPDMMRNKFTNNDLPDILKQQPTGGDSTAKDAGMAGNYGNRVVIAEDEIHGPSEIWPSADGMWAAKNKIGELDFFNDEDTAMNWATGESDGFEADHLGVSEPMTAPMDGNIRGKTMDPRQYEDYEDEDSGYHDTNSPFNKKRPAPGTSADDLQKVIQPDSIVKEYGWGRGESEFATLAKQGYPMKDLLRMAGGEYADMTPEEYYDMHKGEPLIPSMVPDNSGIDDDPNTMMLPPTGDEMNNMHKEWKSRHPQEGLVDEKRLQSGERKFNLRHGYSDGPVDEVKKMYQDYKPIPEHVRLQEVILNEWRENNTVWRKTNGGFGAKNRRGKLKYFKDRTSALAFARTGSTMGSIKDVVIEEPTPTSAPLMDPEAEAFLNPDSQTRIGGRRARGSERRIGSHRIARQIPQDFMKPTYDYNAPQDESVSTQLEDYLPEDLVERNYAKEYANYQGRPDQKKNRAMRNKVRREALRTGKATKHDKKDIHHKDMNTHNTDKKNLALIDQSKNRSNNRHHPGEKQMNELEKDTYRSAANQRWDKGSARTRKPAGEQWHSEMRTPEHLQPVYRSKSLDKYNRAEELRDKKVKSEEVDTFKQDIPSGNWSTSTHPGNMSNMRKVNDGLDGKKDMLLKAYLLDMLKKMKRVQDLDGGIEEGKRERRKEKEKFDRNSELGNGPLDGPKPEETSFNSWKSGRFDRLRSPKTSRNTRSAADHERERVGMRDWKRDLAKTSKRSVDTSGESS